MTTEDQLDKIDAKLDILEEKNYNLDSNFSVLTASMNSIKTEVVAIADAARTTNLAMAELSKCREDVNALFKIQRDITSDIAAIRKEMHEKSDEHNGYRVDGIDACKADSGKKMDKYAGIMFAFLIIAIGYLVVDDKENRVMLKDTHDVVIANGVNIKHLKAEGDKRATQLSFIEKKTDNLKNEMIRFHGGNK